VPDAAAIRRLLLLSAAALAVRIVSAIYVSEPGYTDAYYYADVASRLAHGQGLSADFVWNFIEAPGFSPLPVASHRFWVPLTSVLGALGIASVGGVVGEFRGAQAAIVAVAAFVPLAAYAAARELDVAEPYALGAAGIAGLGGVMAPGFVATDSFAPAALIGTLFFLMYRRAAAGSVSAGVLAGALVGLLYLARTEGAFFGLALLALIARPDARRAGVAGSAVALAIGGAWFARDLAVGVAPDLVARTTLLVRYESFFAIASPSAADFVGSLPAVLSDKLTALIQNALTAVFTFAALLAPLLAIGAWRLRRRAQVGAYLALLAAVYAAQSLVWTLHSTHGSYFHSLSAFFPFGVALAAAGTQRVLGSRDAAVARLWVFGGLIVIVALTYGSVVQWDATFGALARERRAAADLLLPGPLLASDAAAWRYITGHVAVVTPADGPAAAACAAARYGAKSLVLDSQRFSAYDAIWDGARPAWLGPPESRGRVRVFPIYDATCDGPIIR
jgi:hypothetical protein